MSHSKDPISIDDKDFERLKLEIYNKMNNEESYKNEQTALKIKAKQEMVILKNIVNQTEKIKPSFDESILLNELIDFSKKKKTKNKK
jgi:hypothetical protein